MNKGFGDSWNCSTCSFCQLLKLDEVTTNDQASTTASVSSTAATLSQLKPKLKWLENVSQRCKSSSASQQESVVANHEESCQPGSLNLATADANNLAKAQTVPMKQAQELLLPLKAANHCRKCG